MGNENLSGLPPYSNRGVENTEGERLVSSVDWLSCTFHVEEDPQEVIRILGMFPGDFKPLGKGANGYKNCLFFNQIKVLYNGNEGMGVHVEMSGQGCRTFEKNSNLTWRDLFLRFRVHYVAKCKITRIDIAVDDFKGYFKIPELIKQVKRGSVTSKFKMARQISNIIIKTGEELGYTLYFGRPTSDIQIRFYEKNIEQEMKGNIVPEKAQIWNRTEIQARGDRAQVITEFIADGSQTLGNLVTGILRNYINFRRPYRINGKKTTDSNKSRWDSEKWWLSFLGNVQKVELTMRPDEVSIEKKYKWVDHGVKKTLAMLAISFNNDVDQMITHLIQSGMDKLDDDDWAIIDEFKQKELSFDEYLEKLAKIKKELSSPDQR